MSYVANHGAVAEKLMQDSLPHVGGAGALTGGRAVLNIGYVGSAIPGIHRSVISRLAALKAFKHVLESISRLKSTETVATPTWL